jgi:uncharacterized protein
MFKPFLFALMAIAAVAACSSPTNRVDLLPLQSELRRNAVVSSVMVRTVSLPTYAAAEEIAMQSPEGFIVTEGDILWADQPDRAATLTITRHLNTILSATVGPDPWPFVDLPDVVVEVRVEEIIAGGDGVFRLRGQYFVGGDAARFRNTVRSFNYTSPLPDLSFASVAAAQSQVLLELSEDIAKTLSR